MSGQNTVAGWIRYHIGIEDFRPAFFSIIFLDICQFGLPLLAYTTVVMLCTCSYQNGISRGCLESHGGSTCISVCSEFLTMALVGLDRRRVTIVKADCSVVCRRHSSNGIRT